MPSDADLLDITILPPGNAGVALAEFLAASASGFVQAQLALDQAARASLVRWEEEGLPPAAFAWTGFTLGFSVCFQCEPKRAAAAGTRLRVLPNRTPGARLEVTFTRAPAEGEEERSWAN